MSVSSRKPLGQDDEVVAAPDATSTTELDEAAAKAKQQELDETERKLRETTLNDEAVTQASTEEATSQADASKDKEVENKPEAPVATATDEEEKEKEREATAASETAPTPASELPNVSQSHFTTYGRPASPQPAVLAQDETETHEHRSSMAPGG